MIKEFLKEKYKNILETINYHENIFDISQDIHIGDYLNVRTIVFNFYKTFSLLDENFENPLSSKLYNDIVNVFLYYDNLNFDEMLKDSYNQYKKTNNIDENSFKNDFSQFEKEIKLKLIAITNQKLFIFDTLMWYKANHSEKLIYFLVNEKLKNTKNTK